MEDRRPRKVDVAGVFIKNRHKKGGQSQNRYQRLNDIQVHEYVRMVAERVREHLSECRHVILAGPGNKKKLVWEELGRSERFELVTCDDDIEKVIEEHLPEDPQELEWVKRFRESVREDLAVYGEKEVQEALYSGQVGVLLATEERWKEEIEAFGGTFVHLKHPLDFGSPCGILRWKSPNA